MTNRRRTPPRSCPVCGDELVLTRLGCPECSSELSGSFEPCEYCSLDETERDMLRVFLRSKGNMKELERHLGVSYPTARARFDRLLTTLGLEAEPEEPPGSTNDRLTLLEQLSQGEIDVAEALERLE